MSSESLDSTSSDAFGASSSPSPQGMESPSLLSVREIFSTPLPHQAASPATRFWVRVFLLLIGHRLIEVRGLKNIRETRDPFILVANHSQRLEALLLPALLTFHRGGRMVHFFTDWLVLLYPLIGRIVRLNQPIIVTHKRAKWGPLDRLKVGYQDSVPPMERARLWLEKGEPVAIFPEGTMNRDRTRMLRGYPGAAQLSLACGVAVVPVGIRFPLGQDRRPISDFEKLVVEFGAPMKPTPPAADAKPEVHEIRDWHAQIMQAISRLSGKRWNPENQRTRYVS